MDEPEVPDVAIIDITDPEPEDEEVNFTPERFIAGECIGVKANGDKCHGMKAGLSAASQKQSREVRFFVGVPDRCHSRTVLPPTTEIASQPLPNDCAMRCPAG